MRPVRYSTGAPLLALSLFTLTAISPVLQFAQSPNPEQPPRELGAWNTLQGAQLPALRVSLTYLPVGKAEIEVLPLYPLGITLAYYSPRIFGIARIDAYERIQAGIRLYPYLVSRRIIRYAGDKKRVRFMTGAIYFQLLYRTERRNSFLTETAGGFLIRKNEYVWASRQGIIMGPGFFVAYGGQRIALSFSLNCEIGYLTGNFYQQQYQQSYWGARVPPSHIMYEGSFAYFNVGGMYLALSFFLGKRHAALGESNGATSKTRQP